MSWDDWVFGVLTGGLYNVGKTVSKAGEAAEDAGTAISVVGTTVAKLGDELDSFLEELGKLLTIERITPRPDGDLWDEEKSRLQALRQREQDLQSQIAAAGSGDFFQLLALHMKLAIVKSAIHAILYKEPGVVPNTLHSLQEILERFNTQEQPRIEDILDSTDDNLEELKDILEQLKKLFVVQTWQAIPSAQLSEDALKKIQFLEEAKVSAKALLQKNEAITTQLHQAMVKIHPDSVKLPLLSTISSGQPIAGGSLNNPGEGPSTNLNVGGMSPNPSGTGPSGNPGPGHDGNIDLAPPGEEGAPLIARAIASTAVDRAMYARIATLATQPQAARIASMLKTNEHSAYLDNYTRFQGRVVFQERQIAQIDKRQFKLKHIAVEQPGVIPQILEAIRQTVTDADATVVELKGTLAKVDAGLAGFGAFLSKNSLLLKIGAAVMAGLTVLIFVATLVLLIKLILVV